jgi:hypothetical protein
MKVLDYKRLGKQRSEALQILKALLGMVKHYKSQPQARAWSGYESALCEYGIVCCEEWKNRGYVDNTKIIFEMIKFQRLKGKEVIMPKWVGYEPFHSNQRSRLLYKNYNWYSQFDWKEEPLEDYYFPEHLY